MTRMTRMGSMSVDVVVAVAWRTGCWLSAFWLLVVGGLEDLGSVHDQTAVVPGQKSQDLRTEQIRSHPTNRSSCPMSGFRCQVSAVRFRLGTGSRHHTPTLVAQR